MSFMYLALSEGAREIFEKVHSNKMMKFRVKVYFRSTMNYKSIFFLLNSILYTIQLHILLAKQLPLNVNQQQGWDYWFDGLTIKG